MNEFSSIDDEELAETAIEIADTVHRSVIKYEFINNETRLSYNKDAASMLREIVSEIAQRLNQTSLAQHTLLVPFAEKLKIMSDEDFNDILKVAALVKTIPFPGETCNQKEEQPETALAPPPPNPFR